MADRDPDPPDAASYDRPEDWNFRDWLVDRTDEAAAVVKAILAAKSKVVVIHGRRGSGISNLILRWVAAGFPEDHEVYYAECSPRLPATIRAGHAQFELVDALKRDAILFLDSFDRFLLLSADDRNAGLNILLTHSRVATLVLAVHDENLGELLALRSHEPAMMENLIEIKPVPVRKGLERLSAATEGSHCCYSPDFISALEEDLTHLTRKEYGLSPDLLKAIDSQVLASIKPDSRGIIGKEDYSAAGGLRGILRSYLERRIEEARRALGEFAGDVALATIEEVVLARRFGGELNTAEISSRIDVDEMKCRQVLKWLEDSGNLIRNNWSGLPELVPVQLEQIIEEDLERKAKESQDSQVIIRKGLQTWKDLGSVLPPELFREVHARRTSLRTTDQESMLLLDSAIHCVEKEDLESVRYWLARIGECPGRITTLLKALYSEGRPAVRRRAARLLRDFDEPEVLSHIYRAALQDPDPCVRQEAIASLDGLQNQQFHELLILEAHQAASPYRRSAIQALRIYRDDRTARELERLVSDPDSSVEVRAEAVEALGAMEYAAAARALARISLNDKDEDDRRKAAESMTLIRSEELAAETLSALRRRDTISIDYPKGRPEDRFGLRRSAGMLAAIAILLLTTLGHGAVALFMLRRYRLAIPLLPGFSPFVFIALEDSGIVSGLPPYIVSILIAAWFGNILAAASILLLKRARLHAKILSFEGILGIGLFALIAAVSFFCSGVAYLLIRRFRRGFEILAYHFLGVLCLLLYWLDSSYLQVFEVTPLARVCLLAGVPLFLGSWLWDIAAVAHRQLLFPKRALVDARKSAVFERILSNTHVVNALVSQAQSKDRRKARWAKKIIGAFPNSLPPALCADLLKKHHPRTPGFLVRALKRTRREETIRTIHELWPEAGAETRSQIVAILAGHPSERSLEYLGKLWPQMALRAKARYVWAKTGYPFRSIPLPVLLAIVMAIGLAFRAIPIFMDWSELLVRFIDSPRAVQRQPLRVVTTAKFLVEAFPQKTEAAIDALGRVLDETTDRRLRAEVLRVLTEAAGPGRPKASAGAAQELLSGKVSLLEDILKEPDAANNNKSMAVKSLELVRSAEALDALKDFVLEIDSRSRPTRKEDSSIVEDEAVRLGFEAVESLGRIDTPDAAKALEALSASAVFGNDARKASSKIYRMEAERLLSISQTEKAFDMTRQALKVDQQNAEAYGTLGLIYLRKNRPLQALDSFSNATRLEPKDSWAWAMQASILLERKDFVRSTGLAEKAIQANPQYSWSYILLSESYHKRNLEREAAAHLERLRRKYGDNHGIIGSLMYVYHEQLSRTDSKAYARNYELYAVLMKKLGDNTDETQAGFIEANLTTGRYAAVLHLGPRLLKTTKDTGVRLVVSILIYAASILQTDFRRALLLLDELEGLTRQLPADFDPRWTFDGTRHYIETCSFPEEIKLPLLELVSAISKTPGSVPEKIFDDNRLGLRRVR